MRWWPMTVVIRVALPFLADVRFAGNIGSNVVRPHPREALRGAVFKTLRLHQRFQKLLLDIFGTRLGARETPRLSMRPRGMRWGAPHSSEVRPAPLDPPRVILFEKCPLSEPTLSAERQKPWPSRTSG